MKDNYTIGVLIGNANSPHTMDLMQGIYCAAKELNVNLLYFLGIHSRYYYSAYFGQNSEDDYDYQFNIVYDYAWLGKVDAIIISYGTLCIFMDEVDKQSFLKRFDGIPYVLLEETDETMQGTSIIVDNYNGMFHIVEHLVKDHHYREFTYLSGPKGNTDAEQRRTAVLDVMKKYNLPFDESRIAYGDYSPCVEDQVNRLLNDYPQMDAMICANDLMADTVYREFGKRGIVPGRDIAVTGFDDSDIAESMNPPLTTVLQNAHDMGYMAVVGALELCVGKRPHSVVVPASIQLRESCGCLSIQRKRFPFDPSLLHKEWSELSQKTVEIFLDQILLENSSESIRGIIRENLQRLLCINFMDPANQEEMLSRLKSFLEDEAEKYISSYALLRCFNECFDAWLDLYSQLPENAAITSGCSGNHRMKSVIQNTIVAHIVKTNNDRSDIFRQESWFLPLISRDMMSHIDEEKEFYRGAMIKLHALRARSSYLYIFEEPIVHHKHDPWKHPDKMYLASCHEGDKVYAFDESDRPVLTMENGIRSFCSSPDANAMSVFCLFSDEVQYGILVTEIDPANVPLSYLISMQIANALKFHELSRQQKKTQQELEKLVNEINEKNEVLNFISEYDSLTGSLNRRGFLERALELNRNHSGEVAAIVFADLDHLKEINDQYGHYEGDFAIQHVAETLKKMVDGRGIVGRLGGDEFVAFFISEDTENITETLNKVKLEEQRYNLESQKQYYIEASTGVYEFVCSEEIVISEVLRMADSYMYEGKKKRRLSVVKNL